MSPGYSFTERVRSTLHAARTEAVRLHHDHVGPEHILLGLLQLTDGIAVRVLDTLHVDIQHLKVTLESRLPAGDQVVNAVPDLPYTARAKKVLELSMTAARELRDNYVGTEHLLLALIREEKSMAAWAIREVGIPAADILATLAQVRRTTGPELALPASEVPRQFTLLTKYSDGTQQAAEFTQVMDVMKHLAQWLRHP